MSTRCATTGNDRRGLEFSHRVFVWCRRRDVDAIDRALGDQQLCLPPVVLPELFTDPNVPPQLASTLKQIPLLEVSDGFWERAGRLRSRLVERKRRARLADSLIAQSCLDNDLALITRDLDFRAFAEIAELKIVPA